jgi:hypothetical protein
MQTPLAPLALAILLGCSAPRLVVDAPTTTAPAASASPTDAPPASVAVGAEETPLRAGETWSGTYECPQGVTQLELRIRRVDGYEVEARFAFLHAPSGATGEFALRGLYSPGARYLRFVAGDWITRPPGYETVDLDGNVSPDGRVFAGRIDTPECGKFSVQRTP